MSSEIADVCFTTSYKNMISDHNSITLRVGLDNNNISDQIQEIINFDIESHLKKNLIREKPYTVDGTCVSFGMQKSKDFINIDADFDDLNDLDNSSAEATKFRRKFLNIDATKCWLNSSLQLLLTALDHSEASKSFSSDLGQELISLKSSTSQILDATEVKYILVSAEDLRIATRISEINDEIKDPRILKRRLENVEDLRLNLISGEQCVRDFYVCINENSLSWPDVYSSLSFSISHSSRCTSCNDEFRSNTVQTYIELDVPADNSSLDTTIHEYLNNSSFYYQFCETCTSNVKKLHTKQITRIEDAPFITVFLRRLLDSQDGLILNKNAVISTNSVSIK